jgi:hypothetical protein
MRASQFARFLAPDGQVVMLGDSITEFGLWQERFAGMPVLNRGIGAEVSDRHQRPDLGHLPAGDRRKRAHAARGV